MTARKFRAVTEGETAPEPARAKTVTQAADTGTHRDLLVAMRDRVAKAVEDPNTPARDLAALTRRLLEIAREIEAIDSRAGGDDIGDAASTPDADFSLEAL
jgi:hypothetical protein